MTPEAALQYFQASVPEAEWSHTALDTGDGFLAKINMPEDSGCKQDDPVCYVAFLVENLEGTEPVGLDIFAEHSRYSLNAYIEDHRENGCEQAHQREE